MEQKFNYDIGQGLVLTLNKLYYAPFLNEIKVIFEVCLHLHCASLTDLCLIFICVSLPEAHFTKKDQNFLHCSFSKDNAISKAHFIFRSFI